MILLVTLFPLAEKEKGACFSPLEAARLDDLLVRMRMEIEWHIHTLPSLNGRLNEISDI